MSKVLMIAPGRKTNGGITKVIEYYRSTPFWTRNEIVWIETYCTGSPFRKVVAFLSALVKFLLHAKSARISHIHFTGMTSSNRKIAFYCLSRIFGLKVVCHIHAPNADSLNEIANWSFRRMVKGADAVIVLSRIWERALSRIVHRQYIVLNNPSDRFVALPVQKEKIVLFAGKLEDRKGYRDLIYAFSRAANFKGYTLVMAGDGDVEGARELAKDLGLSNVVVPGWLDSSQIGEYFRRAEIFVLPSYGEGFPISVIDALSHACAVITTPVGGIPDFLTSDTDCVLVPPGDIGLLAEALNMIFEFDDVRSRIAENGLELARKNFDKNVITRQLESIYGGLSS